MKTFYKWDSYQNDTDFMITAKIAPNTEFILDFEKNNIKICDSLNKPFLVGKLYDEINLIEKEIRGENLIITLKKKTVKVWPLCIIAPINDQIDLMSNLLINSFFLLSGHFSKYSITDNKYRSLIGLETSDLSLTMEKKEIIKLLKESSNQNLERCSLILGILLSPYEIESGQNCDLEKSKNILTQISNHPQALYCL